MSEQLNHRLTATDASFLYVETPQQPMHIGGVLQYDGYVSREQVIDTLCGRIHQLPRYRQRVIFPPFGLAHPTWEDDPSFDVANHVEEVTLPAPGDDRILSEVGGREYARPLDRRRPLWKLVLLQGRPEDKTAIVAMVHHAMVDGISGVELTMVMHDLIPDAPPSFAEPWQPQPLPDTVTQIADALRDRLTDAATFWTDETFAAIRPAVATRRLRALFGAATAGGSAMWAPLPRVPINGILSGERQFAWVELGLPQVRFIKSVLGGTVNDVVLAIFSGGLGRYLRAHGVSTRGMVLRAMCPVSMRAEDQRDSLGNLVSVIIAPLCVDIADPIERLRAERAAMEGAKQRDEAAGLFALSSLAALVPPGPALAMMPLAAPFPNPVFNTVSTNVPGPQVPMYLGDRQLVGWYPLGPLSGGIGLFQAILSYNQKLTFGATVDPRLVPDAWFYVGCVQDAFDELLETAVATATARDGEAPAAPAVQGTAATLPAAAPVAVG